MFDVDFNIGVVVTDDDEERDIEWRHSGKGAAAGDNEDRGDEEHVDSCNNE